MGDVSIYSSTSSQAWREEDGRGGEFFVNNKENPTSTRLDQRHHVNSH